MCVCVGGGGGGALLLPVNCQDGKNVQGCFMEQATCYVSMGHIAYDAVCYLTRCIDLDMERSINRK